MPAHPPGARLTSTPCWRTWWLAAFVLFQCAAASAAAATTTVANTATFSFQTDASAPVQVVTSNTATLIYPDAIPAPTPSTVSLMTIASSGAVVAADGTQCQTTNGTFVPVPGITGPNGTALNLNAIALQRTGSLHAGDPIFIRVFDPNRNTDPTSREFVDVHLTSSAGDDEVIRLQETGPNTGVFIGVIQTASLITSPVSFDGRLSVGPNATISVSYTDSFYPTDQSAASLLVDPFGVVFDSSTGQPINGATITLVNAATNQPASVIGDDGVSAYPATVTSGNNVSDASGHTYSIPAGAFRFPMVAAGDYLLRVVPPAGYTAPSTVPLATLIALHADGGEAFAVGTGSFGDRFTVMQGSAIKHDVPIDPVPSDLVVQKLASVATASTGDFVQFEVTVQNRGTASTAPVVIDRLPPGLRYRSNSMRAAGAKTVEPVIAADGRTLTIPAVAIPANTQRVLSYVTQVIAGAPVGDAVNNAWAVTGGGVASNVASAVVRIRPPLFSDRFTIIGRVRESSCDVVEGRHAVAGARLLLDDGTYVVTDREGMYHFEAVRPGTHVVQLDVGALGDGFEVLPCGSNTRFAGRAYSQFVEGDGGSLMRADFHVRRKAGAAASTATPLEESARVRATITSEVEAAGANQHWLEGRTRGVEWLFPKPDHNPRAPVIRIAIKHDVDQTVRLTNHGEVVSLLSYDGTEVSADQSFAVSVWRGLPLAEGDNVFDADILAPDGSKVTRLSRVVHYANAPTQVEWVPEQSRLTADGLHKAVLAVRLRDRSGHPVHAGLIGPFRVNAPYTAALEVELQQTRQLAGLDRNPTQYKVEGDDGIAYIELAPTTETGAVVLQFDFDRGLAPGSSYAGQSRSQEVRAWLTSDRSDWVVVGFAKGTVGYDKLAAHVEALPEGEHAGVDTKGQISLYAKGQILGDWLMTLAYDSAKPIAERQRDSLLGVINPQQFYTLYGDGSQQRPDAASASKLYLKLERNQFHALFGDFETGLTESKLARYSRTLNGAKTEYHGENGISVIAFASETAQGYGRDELRGNGTSGLYRLSQANILINSERIRIETRDRFRSDIIVESHALSRYTDYDIDYAGGTLFFREPVLSQDTSFNPVFIVAEYETEGSGVRKLTAGGRAAVAWMGGSLTTGLSAIHDANDANTTNLVGVDARVKLPASSELRAELARSKSDQPIAFASNAAGNAYLVELEHNDERGNAIAYLHRQDPGFGLSQQNAIETGTTKYGIDAQYALAAQVKLTGQAYHLESLSNGAERNAVAGQVEYRIDPWTLRAGLIGANDTSSTGTKVETRQVTVGASRTFLDNRLEVSAQADVSIGGKDQSSDYPSRYVLGAAYALTERLKLIAAEEYATGDGFHALTTRAGLQVDPWKDAQLVGTVNQSSISEYGPRTFGVLGLKQAFPIDDHWTLDVSADGSRTFHGAGPAASTTSGSLVAPGSLGNSSLSSNAYGSSSLGASTLSSSGGTFAGASTPSAVSLATLTENFTAFTAGATYRADLWTWNGRVESRNGQLASRHGLTSGFLRQADAGIAFAASAQVFGVSQSGGVRGLLARADLSWAFRPVQQRWAALDKLEFKRDQLTNGSGAFDGALFGANSIQSTTDARSTRLVNNLVFNGVGKRWSERDTEGNLLEMQQRNQWSIYYGSKYVFDRYDDADYRGYTDLIGVEARIDVTRTIDVGARINRLHAWDSHTTSYSAGPSVGFVPITNAWISVGYNVRGFRDRDFGATDYTARGPYVTMRFKFDQESARAVASAVASSAIASSAP